ncbi:hypothetical protein GL218_06301 [Daldinia childiae]|uniref:uncharacterized protein n=1 Tax=Daldinia childiae TaxID=326645 RepID=UPI001445BCC7|nr:uncharacterized protein GL218_06301 [Daldinia childiae]KAF3057464.1 hypothetical protein GL218_06301 [Daldinia childiae]
MPTTSSLHAQLDALYTTWANLSPSSSPAEFDKFANFFDDNCRAWLLSMRELTTPSIGRQGVVDGIKAALKDQRIEERRVVDRFESADGTKISVEMNNRLVVHGKELDPFPETATAVFNEKGLITDFKVYCCRSAVVQIIQDVTGEGPYKCHPFDG